MEKTKLTETFYEFTIDNQWRIMLSEELREVYGFEKDIVYAEHNCK
jgi:DNA-binding transcriptional regulator/RsmH inhibitor MraZ